MGIAAENDRYALLTAETQNLNVVRTRLKLAEGMRLLLLISSRVRVSPAAWTIGAKSSSAVPSPGWLMI